MHHLPKIFDLRKNSKKMEQAGSPRPKLHRKNAVKNFEYIPSPPASTSPSTSGSSYRGRSFDLPRDADRTRSFRIYGNDSEVKSVMDDLGLQPDDFEIPIAAYEAFKSRSPSEVIRPKEDHFGSGEAEEPQNEVVQNFSDTLTSKVENEDQINGVAKADTNSSKLKPYEDTVPPLNVNWRGPVGRGGGIKGDRPPLLTPPPAMALPILDDGCSTWDLLKGFAPDDDNAQHLSHHGASHVYENEEEVYGENVHRERLSRLRTAENISGSCSFTTTNDDDSSSTTTEPVSIISPNGGCRVNISHWEKGDLLGRGSFGTVYEGISSEGFFFAVKEVSLLEQGSQGKQSIYYLEQEIELLSQFEHENIVRYLGTDKNDSKLYIFLELVTQGSLASLYQKYKLRDSHVSAYTRQILLGLKYLHERNVIHRDIKCANILVASDGTVKLADFGLAKATKLNDLKSCKGTAFWMAPEVVNHKNKGYGLAADIWSLGCTVLEMLTGHVPYFPLEFMQALFRIGKGEPPPIPNGLSRDAKDLIQQCLRVNPNDRPTAAELLDHPFVQRTLYSRPGSESPMPSRF